MLLSTTISSVSAGALDFYSTIDDAGESLAESLTTRHLQSYTTFRSFGRHCRDGNSWLDTEAMNEEHLRDIANGNF